jgi:hypothetical protein
LYCPCPGVVQVRVVRVLVFFWSKRFPHFSVLHDPAWYSSWRGPFVWCCLLSEVKVNQFLVHGRVMIGVVQFPGNEHKSLRKLPPSFALTCPVQYVGVLASLKVHLHEIF